MQINYFETLPNFYSDVQTTITKIYSTNTVR